MADTSNFNSMTSAIQKAFDSGNYVLVRQLAKKSQKPKDLHCLHQIETDPKIIYAGLFGLFVVLIATLLTLH